MSTKIRVLIVEDHPEDAELMARQLKEEGFKFKWQRVETESAYLDALETQPDLILSDWSLPQFSGQRALKLMQERELDIPFILVTGSIGEELAVAAMQEGIYDYVLKDHTARLGQSVNRALEEKRLRRKRRKTEEELRKSEEQYRMLVDNATDVVWTLDPETGKFTYFSPSVQNLRGYSPAEAVAIPLDKTLTPNSLRLALSVLGQALTWEQTPDRDLSRTRLLELEEIRKDGSIVPTEARIKFLRDAQGKPAGLLGITRDITERKQAEEELVRAAREWQTTFDATNDAMWVLDEDQHILRSNKTTERFFHLPSEELHLAETHSGEIHLLVTDVVMPEMNGKDLAERLISIRPGLKYLYMSGYTASAITHSGVLDEGMQFVQKPFSMKSLAAKVREVLDG